MFSMKRIRKSFKTLPIDQKLSLSFTLPLFIMLAFSLILTDIALRLYDKKIYTLEATRLNSIIETLEKGIDEIDASSYSVAMDALMQNRLNEISNEINSEYLYGIGDIYSSFVVSFSSEKLTKNFIYKNDIIDFRNGSLALAINEEKLESILQKTNTYLGALYTELPSSDFPYLVSAREIRHYINADLKYLGTLIFITNIDDILDSNKNESTTFLFNTDGELIYGNQEEGSELKSFIASSGYYIKKIGGERLFISVAKSNRLTSISTLPYSNLFSLTRITRTLLILSFILLYTLIFFSIKKITLHITRPIHILSVSMIKASDGNLDEAISILEKYNFQDDEIGSLAKEYKSMIVKLKKLIIERYEEQILLKDTRYKMLKAQINPHFLYNTLNSIGWMIKLKKLDESGKMLLGLGNLLHKAFDISQVTTLGEEENLFLDYAYIQKMRYGDRFQYTIDIPNNLKETKIPPLTLQPLVENALKYGTDTTGETSVIEIKAREKEDFLILTIGDNGPGFSKERLKEVQSMTYKGKGSGIGIKNIVMRLNLIYGNNSNLQIESYENKTVITIKIPRGNF